MTNKDIDVNFVNYQPYDTIPSMSIHMGQINTRQALRLIDTLSTTNPEKHGCVQRMDINFSDISHFAIKQLNPPRVRTLDLDGMFCGFDYEDYHDTPLCVHGPEMNFIKTEEDMVKLCATKLKRGKCCDPFICRTLGAALFPQFYAKSKQK